MSDNVYCCYDKESGQAVYLSDYDKFKKNLDSGDFVDSPTLCVSASSLRPEAVSDTLSDIKTLSEAQSVYHNVTGKKMDGRVKDLEKAKDIIREYIYGNG